MSFSRDWVTNPFNLEILPTEIKELNADPYMFIFDTLLTNKDSVDYVFNIYEVFPS